MLSCNLETVQSHNPCIVFMTIEQMISSSGQPNDWSPSPFNIMPANGGTARPERRPSSPLPSISRRQSS